MSGWIKLHRGIFDHWIASDPDYFCVWLRMLTEANFEDKKHLFNGALLEIKRGQIIFGLEAWSAKTGVTIAKLRKLLEMLENDKMINRQKTNKYSLISIVNYALYQDDDRQTACRTHAEDKQNATPKELKNIRSKEDNNLVDSGESPSEKNADFLSELFEKFWGHYTPVQGKQGKQKALAKFKAFLKGKSEGQCRFWMNLMLAYYMDCRERQVVGYDALHAATYIHNKRWEDSPEFMENFKREWLANEQR
jgi:hypothetical protein